MFYSDSTTQPVTDKRAENAKYIKFKIDIFAIKMGGVVFTRQIFIYQGGPTLGISLDIDRHTELT